MNVMIYTKTTKKNNKKLKNPVTNKDPFFNYNTLISNNYKNNVTSGVKICNHLTKEFVKSFDTFIEKTNTNELSCFYDINIKNICLNINIYNTNISIFVDDKENLMKINENINNIIKNNQNIYNFEKNINENIEKNINKNIEKNINKKNKQEINFNMLKININSLLKIINDINSINNAKSNTNYERSFMYLDIKSHDSINNPINIINKTKNEYVNDFFDKNLFISLKNICLNENCMYKNIINSKNINFNYESNNHHNDFIEKINIQKYNVNNLIKIIPQNYIDIFVKEENDTFYVNLMNNVDYNFYKIVANELIEEKTIDDDIDLNFKNIFYNNQKNKIFNFTEFVNTSTTVDTNDDIISTMEIPKLKIKQNFFIDDNNNHDTYLISQQFNNLNIDGVNSNVKLPITFSYEQNNYQNDNVNNKNINANNENLKINNLIHSKIKMHKINNNKFNDNTSNSLINENVANIYDKISTMNVKLNKINNFEKFIPVENIDNANKFNQSKNNKIMTINNNITDADLFITNINKKNNITNNLTNNATKNKINSIKLKNTNDDIILNSQSKIMHNSISSVKIPISFSYDIKNNYYNDDLKNVKNMHDDELKINGLIHNKITMRQTNDLKYEIVNVNKNANENIAEIFDKISNININVNKHINIEKFIPTENIEHNKQNSLNDNEQIMSINTNIESFCSTTNENINLINFSESVENINNIKINKILNSLKQNVNLKIINVYQLCYNDGKNATGLGDFIRGSYFLMEFCKKYGFNFSIDLSNHPIKFFLKKYNKINLPDKIKDSYKKINKFEHDNFNPSIDDNKFINNISNKNIYNEFIYYLNNEKNNNLSNNIYIYSITFPNFQPYINSFKNEMQNIFELTERMQLLVNIKLKYLSLKSKNYEVIHIRCGDDYLSNVKPNLNNINYNFLISEFDKLNPNKKYLLISDNNYIKILLKNKYNFINILCHEITHTCEFKENMIKQIENTVLDFYLISQSKNVMAYSVYQHGSGFSKWCAFTYDIPYFCKYFGK